MNDVQSTYAPPRATALLIGGFIFTIYHIAWHDTLIKPNRYEYPAPFPLDLICSIVLGYGLTMVGWLIGKTKGRIIETFRPTRGRILTTIALFLFTPVAVIGYLPWIIGGLIPFTTINVPSGGPSYIFFAVVGGLVLACYVLASMIVHQTHERLWLRFGLCATAFWAVYSALILITGIQEFRL